MSHQNQASLRSPWPLHRLFARAAEGPRTPTAGNLAARAAGPSGVVALRRIDVADSVFYLFAADVIGPILAAAAIFRLYATPLDYNQTQLWAGVGAFVVAWAYAASVQKVYARKALLGSFHRLVLRAMAACAIAFGIMLLAGFALSLIAGISRVWLLGWATSVFLWVGFTRTVWRASLRRRLRRGFCLERVLVLAASTDAAGRLANALVHESGRSVGVAAATALPGTLGGATLDWVEETARSGHVDRVVIGRISGAMVQANAALARLTRLAVDVTVLPDLDGLQAPVLNVNRIGMLPAIDLDFRPLSPARIRLKRAEDLVIAGLLTLMVLPVLVMVAIAIKLDSRGPVFFRQQRTGFNDRVFKVWKFRTMRVDARDDLALRQTSRNDPRVTRLGAFLRCTSIDELPQLFNVLVGDMSIVGPRPHALGMTTAGMPLRQVIEDYSARHRLKPGITGWAQINGSRGEVNTQEKLRRRVSLDCYYIENWSLGLDLWIIARTAAMVLGDRNAY